MVDAFDRSHGGWNGRSGRRPDPLRRPEEQKRAPRASSEGCVRRRPQTTQVTKPPAQCMWVDERRRTKATDTKKSQPSVSEDIYDQVSSLVEELEAARARAMAAGGQLPRAVEAAASALEPLLRLRDVTGAACDLTAMPWLPQLLSVFRNVLRTAVGGVVRADAAASDSAQGVAAAAQAAAAAAAAISALGAGPQGLSRMESDVLRDQLKKQDSQLKIAKQREIELQQKLDEVQKERDKLLNKESDGGNWFAKRVVDLEREASEWNAERQSVDARISQLVDIVSAALEDKPLRRERKHVSPRS
ncbi:unnamed protein product [Cladocopium goreaui]|uniref:ABC transmembrane type-1 domain-containing protein n=1 Tax=Cladocopium goreaui TaxID=2562237 RepID=A0A9P1FLI5_9DINO|nr:unnamed protein product [Cladocopium goreaui]|mmetsp:Transcript_12919/g.27044  ORF Transcript_12919/g.27044 Transcript_12919/m.27044 type:complete len:303 (+) Transcript_12919:48-956(+)